MFVVYSICNMLDNINPNFRTDPEHYSRVEIAKINSNELRGNLFNEFRNQHSENISWESEQIAKSHGIYLEFNRAKTGNEKDWMYMLRISIPGGGPITSEQWNILDRAADMCTIRSPDTHPNARPSLRITTRQNIQLHWVSKKNVVDTVSEIGKSGLYDREVEVTRFDYGPNQLNRKFKIAFSAIHYVEEKKKYVPDNCVELRTNDIGVAPIINNSNADDGGGKVDRFQVYIGGGQGQQSGKPTISALGKPFGIFTEDNLLKGLDNIVRVHKEWGDRQNRHWARLKYVVKVKGIEWFREQVRNIGDINFEPPILDYDYGDRNLHLGWIKQHLLGDSGENLKWCYGAFIENGRIIDDSPNGDLKSMVKYLMKKYPTVQLFTTPNQHLLFSNIDNSEKERFENDMRFFGYGVRKNIINMTNRTEVVFRPYSKLRMLSGACVGRDTCRLTYTDSEKFEPYLIDELEEKWGDLNESIGITGCEKQCYRPATKTIGWIGTGFNLYQLTIMGTEDGRNQGGPLIDP